jgi:hypothetical protein
VSAFYLRPVQAGLKNWDDRTSAPKALSGVYGTKWLTVDHVTGFDLYYLGILNSQAVFDQGAGRERRHTLGVRLFGAERAWRWNIEGMYQLGRFAGGDIAAWSVATEVGRASPAAPLKPEFTLRADIVSGDRDPGSKNVQTFNPLFPKGKYFGELTPIAPYNIIDVHPGVSFSVAPTVSLGLSAMLYWRQSARDGVYDVPGQLVRSGQGSSARFIGHQLEGVVSWQVNDELNLSASYSRFQPGAFIKQTGPARSIDMIAFEANYRF